MKAPPTHRGFTLLEMLTAMVMIGALALALFGTMHTAFKARHSAEAAIEPVRTLSLALDMMRQDVQATVPLTGMLALEMLGVDDTDGAGCDHDDVTFYNTVPNAPWPDHPVGFRQVRFMLTEDPDHADQWMLVRRTIVNTLALVTPQPQQEVLCRGARSMNLRYFDGEDWRDDWDSASQDDLLPEAIQISLELVPRSDHDPNERGPRMVSIVTLPCGGALANEGSAAPTNGAPTNGAPTNAGQPSRNGRSPGGGR